jgi:hypothetical protein
LYQLFGGYTHYLKAPKRLVDTHRLIIIARHMVENEQAEKDAKERKELQEKIDALNAQNPGRS